MSGRFFGAHLEGDIRRCVVYEPNEKRTEPMAAENRMLDDLAKVANGALGAFAGVRGEIESMMRHRLDRLAGDLKVVTLDEFDALRALATKAREEQAAMAERVTALEARITALEASKSDLSPVKSSVRSSTSRAKPKPAS
jgi:BMFP domain-containing protein YqiC